MKEKNRSCLRVDVKSTAFLNARGRFPRGNVRSCRAFLVEPEARKPHFTRALLWTVEPSRPFSAVPDRKGGETYPRPREIRAPCSGESCICFPLCIIFPRGAENGSPTYQGDRLSLFLPRSFPTRSALVENDSPVDRGNTIETSSRRTDSTGRYGETTSVHERTWELHFVQFHLNCRSQVGFTNKKIDNDEYR